ncbi:PQ-loop domain-containing transporter [uncultured Tessaracoccus sp.]|uniref:PQ-loop domain-containing transporter n=1 Tax=uncultured Tessaracoccus sp. TaxID=905023 RepID=UPI0026017430|nr:PQ-loop domain-containing transporter [uncultured Tessaracoccus sp.]
MNLVVALSWLAALLGTATALPQFLKILRTRITTGVSTHLWQLSLLGSIAWTFHGFWTGQMAIAWPTLILGVMQVGILVLIRHNERLPIAPVFVMPMLAGVGFCLIDSYAGAAAFGTVAAISPVLGQLAQLRTMRRASDLAGVSVEYLLLNLGAQAMWMSYGWLGVEWAMRVNASAQTLVCGLVVAYFMHRKVSLRRAAQPVPMQVAA